jgi:uncharacterized protein YcbX
MRGIQCYCTDADSQEVTSTCGVLDLQKPKISFTNESQFLLIVLESVVDLQERMRDAYGIREDSFDYSFVTTKSFRPNIVVRASLFADEKWKRIRIGNQYFNASGTFSYCFIYLF